MDLIDARLTIQFNNVELHITRAKALYHLGRHVEAKTGFKRAIDLDPAWTHTLTPWLELVDDKLSAKPTVVE